MARMPGAEWRGPLPSSNYSPGREHAIVGVTVHHMDGSLSSADAHFHSPGVQSSAHFGIAYDGRIVQWVDTGDVAYHACNANWTGYIGIENESDPDHPDAPPTAAQIASMGKIIAWLGVPASPVVEMGQSGVGYHRQFGGPCAQAWGQTACPGDGFVAAIPAICAAAYGQLPSGDDEVTPEQMDTLGVWMKQQREIEEKTIGQWLKDVEGRINAHTDAKIAGISVAGAAVDFDALANAVADKLATRLAK